MKRKTARIVWFICVAAAALFCLLPAAERAAAEQGAAGPKPTVRPLQVRYDYRLPATKLTPDNVERFFRIELGKEYSRGEKLSVPFTIAPREAYDEYDGSTPGIAVRLELSVFLEDEDTEPYLTKKYVVMLRRTKGYRASGVIEVLLKLDLDDVRYTWEVIACNGKVGPDPQAEILAEEDLKEVRCSEWKFSAWIPDGLNAYPLSRGDEYGRSAVCGGLAFSAGGEEDLPQIRILRRSRFYSVGEYLTVSSECELEEYGNYTLDDFRTYSLGGRTLYGISGVVYGAQGEEAFREIRLIPASGITGTEFTARYTAETETAVLSMLDTVIRYYRPDETEKKEAGFLPAGYSEEPDLQNGEYLLRVEDADSIGTEGFFTAALYRPDYYTPEDVHAMRPGDTILIMDRVLTITGLDSGGTEEEGGWYEVDLFAQDRSLNKESLIFTLILTDDGTAYWPYFGCDNHSASRVGEVRVRVPQPEPVPYICDTEDGPELYAEDLLGEIGGDPAMFGIGWNEYNHLCVFRDGQLIRVGTWTFPYSPEDTVVSW